MTKVPHLKWMVVLFLLALLAVGVKRAGTAAGLTLVVGVCWELAETTVVGHHAALTDLLPDLVAVLGSWVVIVGIGKMSSRRSVRRGQRERTDQCIA
jgi:VanZ family protein